jgi:hypothetical protein
MAAQDYPASEATSTSSGSTKQQAKQTASEVTDQAKQKAGELTDQAKQQATAQAADQKDRATEHLGNIGSALHETSSSLRDREEDAMAGLVDQAADQVDRLSHYLNTHTVTELMGEAERFARREPALFLGGAALLGLFGARFLKSSNPERGYRQRDYDPSGGYRRGAAYDYGSAPRRRPRSYGDRFEERRLEKRYGEPRRQQGYTNVHGTRGAEMPNPARSESATSSANPTGASSSRESTPTGSTATGSEANESTRQ